MERNYRLFVKSLPANITSEKIQKLFDKYGSVNKIDIKEKLMNDGSRIAFINITTTDQKLNDCHRAINSTVLEGHNISVELAKENFLDKLKREREEAQNKVTNKPIIKTSEHIIEPINIKIPDKLKIKSKAFPVEDEKLNKNQSLQDFVSPQIKQKNIDLEVDSNTKNVCASEIKRIASLKQRKQLFKAKEQLIRNALKSVDNKKNKIVFSDVEHSGNNFLHHIEPSNNPQLFDDDDGDDNENNEITFDFNKKPQAKPIGNDSRFIMDGRFLEEEDEKNADDKSSEEEEDELLKEKAKEMKILEDVLGKPIIKRDDKNVPIKRTNTMIRYDPTKDDHRKHELKTEVPKPEPKKKRKKKDVAVEEKEEPLPVSTEIFYSVSNDLKKSLGKQEEFSLLKTFGAANIPDSKNNFDSGEAVSHKPTKPSIGLDTKNPFKYDSSESEDEDVPENRISTQNKEKINDINDNISSYQVDTFFLISDDPRFKDAEDFFKTRSTSDESFKNIRRELKNIVRAKVRNNVRKSQPWKKKIRKSNIKRI